MSAYDRFARQRQLIEVGDSGQNRLGASALVLPSTVGAVEGQIARLYADGLGLQPPHTSRSHEGIEPSASDIHPAEIRLSASIVSAFKHEASRAVGVGAALALKNASLVLGFSSQVHTTSSSNTKP